MTTPARTTRGPEAGRAARPARATAVVLALPDQEETGRRVAEALGAPFSVLEQRSFPDGETWLRIDGDVDGRDVVLAGSLDRPDGKILPFLFAADAAREHGARRVVLAAPYLAYLRQDARFAAGEAVTARSVGRLLSRAFGGIVTVDPHLHRLHDLAEVYDVPTFVVRSAPRVAAWIGENVPRPVLVGPDQESRQWVGEVAALLDAPALVLRKTRYGDREVEVTAPDRDRLAGRTPVVLDDIVSTGQTMAVVLRRLARATGSAAICVGIHAVFAPGASDALRGAGAEIVVTTDTIAHETNGIEVLDLVAEGVAALLDGVPPGVKAAGA